MLTTLIIIGLTAAISFSAFNQRRWIDQLILWPPAVKKNNDYYRLISYGLIHADVGHLLFNMVTLFFFGAATERFFNARLGDFGFAFFYVSALIASILPTYLRHINDAGYRSLGASGAVSAVLFAFVLMRPWDGIYLFLIPIPIPAIIYAVLYLGYTIYMDRRGSDNVNHSAHLWGAVYGMLFTVLLDPGVLHRFSDKLFYFID